MNSDNKNEELKKAGLKATTPRIKIMEVLASTAYQDVHFSAEDIYRELIQMGENIGLASVYRVLTQFESAGILDKLNFESGHSVYELAHNPEFDEHHDHMVCIKTGKVIEFSSQTIEDKQEELADSHGYKLIDHRLVLYVEPKEGDE